MVDVQVRMIAHANWRGMCFVPGAQVVMDPQTAAAYVRAGQAEILPDAPAKDIAAAAAKPPVERPGPAVETAAAPAREKRGRKKP